MFIVMIPDRIVGGSSSHEPSDNDMVLVDGVIMTSLQMSNLLLSVILWIMVVIQCMLSLKSISCAMNTSINLVEEVPYRQRFEEGYDLFDSRYPTWLEQFHPEAVPADKCALVVLAPNEFTSSFISVSQYGAVSCRRSSLYHSN